MDNLKLFAKSILLVELVSVSLLLISGLILSLSEPQNLNGSSFFSYRLFYFDYIPAWFLATMGLMAINGIWMFKLAVVEGLFNTPSNSGWGNWGIQFPINPLRLFAVNLIAIPGILVLFLLIRSNGW